MCEHSSSVCARHGLHHERPARGSCQGSARGETLRVSQPRCSTRASTLLTTRRSALGPQLYYHDMQVRDYFTSRAYASRLQRDCQHITRPCRQRAACPTPSVYPSHALPGCAERASFTKCAHTHSPRHLRTPNPARALTTRTRTPAPPPPPPRRRGAPRGKPRRRRARCARGRARIGSHTSALPASVASHFGTSSHRSALRTQTERDTIGNCVSIASAAHHVVLSAATAPRSAARSSRLTANSCRSAENAKARPCATTLLQPARARRCECLRHSNTLRMPRCAHFWPDPTGTAQAQMLFARGMADSARRSRSKGGEERVGAPSVPRNEEEKTWSGAGTRRAPARSSAPRTA
jgi:hypothetical protein